MWTSQRTKAIPVLLVLLGLSVLLAGCILWDKSPDPTPPVSPLFPVEPMGVAAPDSPFVAGVYAGQDSPNNTAKNHSDLNVPGSYRRFLWGPVERDISLVTDWLDECLSLDIACGISLAPSSSPNRTTMTGFPTDLVNAGYNPVEVEGNKYLNYTNSGVKARYLAQIATLAAAIDGHPALSYVEVCLGIEGEPNPWITHDTTGLLLENRVAAAYLAEIDANEWKAYGEDVMDKYAAEFDQTALFYFFSGYWGTSDNYKVPLLWYARSLGIGGAMSGIKRWDQYGDGPSSWCNNCYNMGMADWTAPMCFSDTMPFIGEFSWANYGHWDTYQGILNGLVQGYKVIRPLYILLIDDDHKAAIADYGIIDFSNKYAPYAGQWDNPSSSPGVWWYAKYPSAGYCPDDSQGAFYLTHDTSPADGKTKNVVDPFYRGFSPAGGYDGRGWKCMQTDKAAGGYYFYFDISDKWAYDGTYDVTVTVYYYNQGTGTFELQYDNGAGDAYASAGSHTKTNTNMWEEKVFTITDAVFGNNMTGGNDLRLYNGGWNDDDDVIHMVEVELDDGSQPATPTNTPYGYTATFTHTPTPTPGNTPTPTNTPTFTPTFTPTATGTPYLDSTADDDTHIDRNNVDSNYSTGTGTDLTYDTSDTDDESVLISFDVSTIPPGSLVYTATLKMFSVYHSNSNSITATVYGISNTWDIDSVTWNNRDESNTWGTAGCNQDDTDKASTETDSIAITGVGQWHEWDVTTLVQSWISGTTNMGFKIEPTGGDGSSRVRFASFDHSSEDIHPELDVWYLPAATYTPTPTPTGTLDTPTATYTPPPTWTGTPTATSTPGPTSTFTPTATNTPTATATNTPTPEANVVFNEILALPTARDWDGDGTYGEDPWIELYNGGGTNTDITDWYIVCNTCLPVTYTFPISTTVLSNGWLLLQNRVTGITMTTNTTTTLTLYNDSDAEIDAYTYYTNTVDYSWGRLHDGAAWKPDEWEFPTQGKSNQSATPTVTATP